MKKILFSVYCCVIMQAGNIVEKKLVEIERVSSDFIIGASISNFNSISHETAYISAGRKISELTWKAENVKLLGIDVSYYFSNGLGLYSGYKKNILIGDGVMDDLDWLSNANSNDITNWSHHDKIDVDNVAILDLGLKYSHNFANLSIETVSSINTWISLGYRYENQKFLAYDGYGVYWGIPVSFDGLGITYEQEYKGPYIGLGVDLENNDFILNLGFKYSSLMSVDYTDVHHQRVPSRTFTSDFDETDMLNFNVGLGYMINKSQKISLTYEYTKYDYVRGSETFQDAGGSSAKLIDVGAVDSKNSMINLEYSYIF